MRDHGLLAAAGHPDDTGEADPALATALAAYAEDPAREPEVLSALAVARLLVPVVATEAGDEGEHGADMATVLMRGADGRTALLAFTGLDALHGWDPDGRPVPVPAPVAARAALQDGAVALLIDVAGPVRYLAEVRDASRGPALARDSAPRPSPSPPGPGPSKLVPDGEVSPSAE